jgi:phospholipase/lecithinase/hemolysin
MAMALEQLGERARARTHWKAYLSLEATGTWADVAREHLDPSYGKRPARPFARTRREKRHDTPTATPERALNCLESMAQWLAKQNRPVDT